MTAKAAYGPASAVVLALCGWAASAAVNDVSSSKPAKAEVGMSMALPKGDPKCAALAHVALPDTEIVSVAIQPANLPITGVNVRASDGSGASRVLSGLPAFCRVVGRIHPEPGSDIRFEVWLPNEGWNGRYMGVGNGGFAGSIRYRDMGNAISAGHATASTDTGHAADVAHDASWARGNSAKLRDYGWRAVHLTAVNAKRLIAAYYGRPVDRSYFQSCSNGGRQGLMEASRFPEDYDGILAGAPAAQFTKAAMAMVWVQQLQRSAGAAFRPEQMQLLQDQVMNQCDAVDGQSDGLVDDPRMCRVDLAKLSCGNSSSPQCFSAPQINALRQLYEGPPKSSGRTVAFPFSPSGAELGRPVSFLGWDGYITAGGKAPPQQAYLAGGLLQDLITPPFASIDGFNWKTDPPKVTAALGGVLDVQPNLSKYFARGGKLIIYHGWADAAIPPEQTIDFYKAILRQSGRKAASSARLFMIPGMQHCFGGTGAEMFGEMSAPAHDAEPENNISMALRHWVEHGREPASVIGVSSLPPLKQRLHCAYPARAALKPRADPDKAANYVCRPPAAVLKRAKP